VKEKVLQETFVVRFLQYSRVKKEKRILGAVLRLKPLISVSIHWSEVKPQ